MQNLVVNPPCLEDAAPTPPHAVVALAVSLLGKETLAGDG